MNLMSCRILAVDAQAEETMGRYLHAMLRLLPARSFPSKRIQSILQGAAFGLGLATYFEVSSSGCAVFFWILKMHLLLLILVVVVVVGNAWKCLEFESAMVPKAQRSKTSRCEDLESFT